MNYLVLPVPYSNLVHFMPSHHRSKLRNASTVSQPITGYLNTFEEEGSNNLSSRKPILVGGILLVTLIIGMSVAIWYLQ